MYIKYWKTILWSVFIIFLSSFPGNKIDKIKILNIQHLDKIIHAGMYFILTFIFLFEINKNSFKSFLKIKFSIIVIITSIFYGLIMEILQQYIFIKRTGDIYDLLANILGCIMAYLIFYFINKKISEENTISV